MFLSQTATRMVILPGLGGKLEAATEKRLTPGGHGNMIVNLITYNCTYVIQLQHTGHGVTLRISVASLQLWFHCPQFVDPLFSMMSMR
jgi:hypothetical protein